MSIQLRKVKKFQGYCRIFLYIVFIQKLEQPFRMINRDVIVVRCILLNMESHWKPKAMIERTNMHMKEPINLFDRLR